MSIHEDGSPRRRSRDWRGSGSGMWSGGGILECRRSVAWWMLFEERVRMKVWRGTEESVGGMPEIAYVMDECCLRC